MSLRGLAFGDTVVRSRCTGLYPGGRPLGEIVSGDPAREARNAVTEMNAYFDQAKGQVNFQPKVFKYQSLVDAINKEWKDWDSSWIFYDNDVAKNIGQRAFALTKQIATDAGLDQPPPRPLLDVQPNLVDTASSGIKNLMTLAQIGAGVLIGGYVLASIPRRRK